VKVRKWLPWAFVGLIAASLTIVAGGYGGSSPDSKAARQIRVALVTDVGGLNDRSFNFLANQGLERAERQLNINGRVFISRSNQDYVPNLSTAARANDLVIAVGFLMTAAVNEVAPRFPNTRFAGVDLSFTDLQSRPTNYRGLMFKEQEAGYLVGYLSGLMLTRLPGRDMISSVGGIKIPPVDRFIAGYRAGLRRANRRATHLNGYSQSFTDQAKCKEIALNHIARGARVVFQVAGACGLGALDAARERARLGIGVDADQWYLGRHILTSAVKKVDVAVFSAIQSVVRNTFRGGANTTFGVRQNGVGYGRLSARVPAAFKTRLATIRRQIAAGRIRIPTTVP
jgi:basic membrane protein A